MHTGVLALSDFYFGEFLETAKIGQNYILTKKKLKTKQQLYSKTELI